MYAIKIASSERDDYEDSSSVEAETIARVDRRVWRYSVQDFVCSVWKINPCHD